MSIPTQTPGDHSLQDVAMLTTKAEIEQLGVRYAYAADALGRGDVEEARALARSCFTKDALFEIFLGSAGRDAPPLLSLTGPDGWTDGIHKGFASLGYSSTHHQNGNIQIAIKGDTAAMKSYVTATHVCASTNSIVLATAVYTDQIVHTPEGWRIAHRAARSTSYLQLSGATPPALP